MSTQVSVNPFFSPRQVSNLNAWFDGADPNGNGIIPANGSTLRTWADKSANGRNASGGVSAVFTTGGVSFNGSTQYYTMSVPYSSNYSIFLVATNTTVPQTYFFGRDAIGGSRFPTFIQGYIGAGIGLEWFEAADRATIATTPVSPFMASVDHTQGTNIVGFYYGTQAFSISQTQAYNSAAWDTLGQAGPGANAGFYGGTMKELIFYNSVVTTSQRQQIEGYLAWKWGLQANLPSTHPYKNSIIPPLLNPPVSVPNTIQNPFFLPTQISGCQLWFDAADRNSFVLSGNTIIRWNDKSGNNRVATPGGSPILQANAINGQSAIYYDGNTYGAFNGSVTITTTSIFTFAVFVSNLTGSSEGMRIISFSGPGCADWNCSTTVIPFLYDTNRIQTWRNSSTTTNLTCPAQGSTILTTTYYNGSIAYNSLFGGTSSSAIGSSGSFNISNFAMTFGNLNMRGYLAEVIIFNTVLTTGQIQQVEGYLAWKWGVQSSLSSTFPYRSSIIPPLLNPPITIPSVKTGSWTPLRISGSTMWLDGADPNGNGTIPANGTTISTWTDKSGAGNTVSAGSGQPTYSTNLSNKLGGLSFNGSQALSKGSVSGGSLAGNNTTTFSMFVVCSFSNNTLRSMPFSWDNNTYTYRILFQYDNTNNLSFDFNNWPSPRVNISSFVPTNNQVYIFSGVRNGSVGYLGINGGVTTATGTGLTTDNFTGTTNTLNIGQYANDSSWNMRGIIGEIIFYNTALTDTQRQNVEGYLAWKWGLQNSLPSNHPFKLWPPPP
jgi:hypothetical protein